MSSTPRTDRDPARHFHAVRFYENKASLCRTVADFLSEGAALDQPGLVIATPAHRDALLSELRSSNLDIEARIAAGDLLLLDAREVLNGFMVAGVPDARLFNLQVPAALEQLCRGRKDSSVRAYGEMVDVLWQDGNTTAAIRLEILWNQLAMSHNFSLLCGYAVGHFYKDVGMREVCAQHSHVIPTDLPSQHVLGSAS